MTTEYLDNDYYRKKIKNGVVIYHEILSFHKKDKYHITPDMLEDIAQRYIELRADNALVFAAPHIDKDNYHLHFAISGIEYKSQKTLRMDNQTFADLRNNVERYQLQYYPQLANSVVYTNKPARKRKNTIEQDQNTRSQRCFEMEKRTKKELDKEKLERQVMNCYRRSENISIFFEHLEKDGLETYQQRSRTAGIRFNGKKYRFKTVGIDKDMLQTLENGRVLNVSKDAIFQRQKDLESLSEDKSTKNRLRTQVKTI